MRTTVNLDEDIFRITRSLAEETNSSLGAVLSLLVRKGLAAEAAGAFRVWGCRQVTDACLLGLAVNKGGRLVTMDKKMEELVKDDPVSASHLLVIGSEA